MKLIVSVVLLLFHFSKADDVVVDLPDGSVRGITERSNNGTEYYSYYQIPYAAPPINERRYKDPQDPEPWDGILDATQHTKQCPQLIAMDGDTEDCLYLAVNTPIKPGSDGDLPVLLWIHGGGFMTGSISFYGPQYLMDHGIIVVIIQYRLGPFGFLSTGDGVIPSNLGLKDQRKAINWVYSNIQHFGGDPDKITLMGESAGAISIGYLLQDMSLEGKIRGAIQQSGSSLMRLSLNPTPRGYTIMFAQEIGGIKIYPNISTVDLLELIQTLNTTRSISTAARLNDMFLNIIPSTGVVTEIPWTVVLENSSEIDPIVTKPMVASFHNGDFIKVPTLLSINSEETLVNGLTYIYGYLGQLYDDNLGLVADRRHNLSDEIKPEFGSEVRALYADSFQEDFGTLVRYSTDSCYAMGIIQQASLASAHAPVYMYQFSYAGDVLGDFIYKSVGMNRTSIPGTETVAHGEDLNYVWNSTYFAADGEPTESDLLARKRLLKIVTNFVKYLDPAPENDEDLDNISWPTFSSDELKYLNINKTLEIKSNPRGFKEKSEVYEKYLGLGTVW